jgi:hypothetical protein
MVKFLCAKCSKAWEGRGPARDGVVCDECKGRMEPMSDEKEKNPTRTTKPTASSVDAKLQYLNELRYLLVAQPFEVREAAKSRVNRLCDSIEKDLGV